ncbi:MAG: YifB family Mg chelatase-like AAA ATPase [Deltaproteobacteria bacterium]|jgi:magnesium chelatase family protein|nr:YifB family Mg chelatase-like AAA ATPase [Deltaproteobacteria bacterium]
MLSRIHTASTRGIDAVLINVEVDIQMRGLPGWNMVGLPEMAVKEAKDRVSGAIRNVGYSVPNRKTVINLSPGNLKKRGTHYDLPIAIAMLSASDSCRADESSKYLIAGELSLTGSVIPINGVLIMALKAIEEELDGIIIPAANAWEARYSGIKTVIPVRTLVEVVEFLNSGTVPLTEESPPIVVSKQHKIDFHEVKGQAFAKRGMEIAAAGNHNIALTGPPGTGKTMLAERLPTILPPLTQLEALEVLKIQSWHGFLNWEGSLPKRRPFRAPHHSASYAGLIGGGGNGMPQMGEISLAHGGVLFLDEMSEFRRDVLEVLRQPMESGHVRIVRSGMSISYPADFMLVCAYNPCRCGFLTHPTKICTCSLPEIRRYKAKLSGPLLDRIDLHIEVGPPPHDSLIDSSREESSSNILERVLKARGIQNERYYKPNANLSGREISKLCKLGIDQRHLLKTAAKQQSLSGRSIHRVLKVSRTIADLAGNDLIQTKHIAEALQFRPNSDDIV